jgi:hypothetical protein
MDENYRDTLTYLHKGQSRAIRINLLCIRSGSGHVEHHAESKATKRFRFGIHNPPYCLSRFFARFGQQSAGQLGARFVVTPNIHKDSRRCPVPLSDSLTFPYDFLDSGPQ